MKTYEFSLVLAGVNENTPNLEDTLFEAGCDDGLLCTYNNTVYIDFSREAQTYKVAVMTAIKAIESSVLNAKVISVDAGDYVGLSDIAELSESTRQSIALYKDGKRGKGDFPNPVQRLQGKQPLWRWSEVAAWLASQNKIEPEIADNALITEAFNQALESRVQRPLVKELLGEMALSLA
jgi:predicted DNA-binding transcriptional regulator AlpA